MTEKIQHYKKLVPEVREKTGAVIMCADVLELCDELEKL